MAKLSDKQRKKIIAEYVEGGTSQRKLAEKYHVSPYLIRQILRSDKKLTQKIAEKKEKNTESVLAFMNSKKNDVCNLIDKLLAAMNDPEKIATTSLSQLATAMGIVIDKYTANETIKPMDGKENNLFSAVNGWDTEERYSDIPEIQPTSEPGSEVVEAECLQK